MSHQKRRTVQILHFVSFVFLFLCFFLITIYDRMLPSQLVLAPSTSPTKTEAILAEFDGTIRHRTRKVFGATGSFPNGLESQMLSNNSPNSHNNNNSASIATVKSRRLPQALIIGVKKGGTRALLEFLRLHPAIKAVGPETHFFDRHYDRGLEWYRNQMPPTSSTQLTMEKTPSYFVTRSVPRRVHGMSRHVKLLVVTRDPVTRAMSDYAQTASKRPDVRSFEELAFQNVSSGLVDPSWTAIRIGVYAKYLERWLQYFPLRQFHFVSGENLIKDPAGEMAKVQDFLGLSRVVTHRHFHFNQTKGFPCIKKHENDQIPHCLGKTKGRIHPKLSSRTLHSLREFYRPFNDKFYRLTGIDFGWP